MFFPRETMSWITLAAPHVLDRLSTDERDAIERAGEDSSTDRLAGIVTQVTAMVRGKVATCSENLAKMGAAGTIPDELLWAAATIARDSLVASLPVSESDSEERKAEKRRADELLDQAARCELRIEDPDGALPEADDDGAGDYGGCEYLEI